MTVIGWMALILTGALSGTPPHKAGPGVGRIPYLRAVELLARRQPGEAPRVRFEWPRVAGVAEYRLKGSWATGQQWTVQRVEYNVTAVNATSWSDHLVAFELSLPQGEHAWSIETSGVPPSPDDEPARATFRLTQ